ncbi:MAG: hypothetical protein BM485_16370 [Desulfobulbaceae bacterium DB1]|nr:MAG: hypothetical protein BM485_16370 [Desulfobulbaceae bacterium DB1]
MGKLIASVILSLSLLFLVKEALVSMRSDQEQAGESTAQKTTKPQPVLPPDKAVVFYPPVPAVLPDLNQGYLFNAERFLPGDKEDETASDMTGEKGQEITVDIATVFYAGSIIVGDTRKGLIVYPTPASPSPAAQGANPKMPTASKPRNYTQLVAGDTVSGYKVVAIEADRLVLQQGEETIEKFLNDPKKARIAPPPPPKPHVSPKPPTASTTGTKSVVRSGSQAGSGQTSTIRRIPAPRALPNNVRIQTPGVPRNN